MEQLIFIKFLRFTQFDRSLNEILWFVHNIFLTIES